MIIAKKIEKKCYEKDIKGHFLLRSQIRLYFDNMVLFWWFIEIISILQHWYCINIEKEKIESDSTVLIFFLFRILFYCNDILLLCLFIEIEV